MIAIGTTIRPVEIEFDQEVDRTTGRLTVSDAVESVAAACEPSITDRIRIALMRSGCPLFEIRTQCDERTLLLTGIVSRFHHLQIAIEAARALANGRKIEFDVEVLSALNSNFD